MPTSPLTAFEHEVLSAHGEAGALSSTDVERLMQSPFGMIGSDGSLTRLGDGAPHPRAFGTYPRVLGRYVRERGILTLEAAIRKMTSFPAARLGLRDRGLLRPGMAADITVFDPDAVWGAATYVEPDVKPSGIDYVLVNGVVLVDRGTVDTQTLAGKVIRHGT